MLLILYVAPTLGVAAGLIPFSYRFIILCVVFLVTVYLSYRQRLLVTELGIRRPPLLLTITFAVIPVSLLYVLVAAKVLTPDHESKVGSEFFIFFVFFSAPAQEFIYRSFLFAQLQAFPELRAFHRIMCSALLYGTMHMIYHNIQIVILTTAIGFIWAWCYERTNNLLTVAVSHACLGFAAISLGVI